MAVVRVDTLRQLQSDDISRYSMSKQGATRVLVSDVACCAFSAPNNKSPPFITTVEIGEQIQSRATDVTTTTSPAATNNSSAVPPPSNAPTQRQSVMIGPSDIDDRQRRIRADTPPPPIELRAWRSASEFDTQHVELSSRAQATHEDHVLSAERLSAMYDSRLIPDGVHEEQTVCSPPFFDEHTVTSAANRRPIGNTVFGKWACCCVPLSQTLLIRLFVVAVSVVGLACVTIGVVLGAHTVSSGAVRLTLCMLMVGVGVVLVIVSAIAWRLTTFDANESALSGWTLPSWLAHFNNGGNVRSRNVATTTLPYSRIFNGRVCRDPLLSSLHSEFLWRPPPPSYTATILADDGLGHAAYSSREMLIGPRRQQPRASLLVGSPPPTYRSSIDQRRSSAQTRTTRRTPIQPPSYSASGDSCAFPGSQTFQHGNTRVPTPVAVSNAANPLRTRSSHSRQASPSSTHVSVIDCSMATPISREFHVNKPLNSLSQTAASDITTVDDGVTRLVIGGVTDRYSEAVTVTSV